MVSKKVSDSVSEKFGIGKSFGFGFVQILGIVTHCAVEDGSIPEQSSTLPEVESERTKEQAAVYEAQSTLGESTSCGEICEESESLPILLEGHVAQVETLGCELEESLSFPHLEESHQRLWKDIRNFDTLGTVENEDFTKEIEPKKEDEPDSQKVSTPTSRKGLLIKLLLAGKKVIFR